MKKNKLLPLIILASLLIVLVVAYALLSSYNENKAEKEATAADTEVKAVPVCEIYDADVTKLHYQTKELDITLARSDGVWMIPDDEKFPVDQSAVSKMISTVTALSAVRELESGDSADFGLDKPTLTVTLTAGETDHKFTLGAKNSYNDLTYLGYGEKVFMISDALTDTFDSEKMDLFAVKDTFPSAINNDSVTAVAVINAKGDSNTVSDSDGIEDIVYEAQKYLSFAIPKGYGLDADGLKEYGITEASPRIVIEYNYNGAKASFEVLLGKDPEGKCYYAIPGRDVTYGIDMTGYDALLKFVYYTPSEVTESSTATE